MEENGKGKDPINVSGKKNHLYKGFKLTLVL